MCLLDFLARESLMKSDPSGLGASAASRSAYGASRCGDAPKIQTRRCKKSITSPQGCLTSDVEQFAPTSISLAAKGRFGS